jgi:hypothetical protein
MHVSILDDIHERGGAGLLCSRANSRMMSSATDKVPIETAPLGRLTSKSELHELNLLQRNKRSAQPGDGDSSNYTRQGITS